MKNKMTITLDLDILNSPTKVADVLERLARRFSEAHTYSKESEVKFIDTGLIGTIKVKDDKLAF